MSAIRTTTGFPGDAQSLIHTATTGGESPVPGPTADHVKQAARFSMQREAQKALGGLTYRRKHGDGEREYTYRVVRCMRNPYQRAWNPGVDVIRNRQSGRLTFGNLVTCGSVWHCPICAPKVTEYRRAELSHAAAKTMADGGELVMMTLTFRHDVDMRLVDSLDAFYKARGKFFGYRAVKDRLAAAGKLGLVYSTEVTYGENGWHPHLHVLIVCRTKRRGIVEGLEPLRDYWGRAVFKSGLGQINAHGFDVRNGDYAAEYIAKYGREPATFQWSASHELTKAHVKQGRGGNLTPFDLLSLLDSAAATECGGRTVGPAEARALFQEYAVQFQGKKQLNWSKGLREAIGLEAERTDEEIADGDAEFDVVGYLTLDDWRLVLSHRNGRGNLLKSLYVKGTDALPHILAALRRAKPNRPDEPWFSEEQKFRGY